MLNIDFSQPLLAIDCGTSVMSLGVCVNHQRFEINQNIGAKQSENLLPALRDLYAQAGIDTPDLVAIVFNQGPGAFTGLRVGIGVAQGLAVAFDIPLIGVPSLDALAYSLPPCPCVLAAMDARMGEVFYAFFDTVKQQRLSDYCVGRASDIKLPEHQSQCLVVGNIKLSGSLNVINYIEKMPTANNFLSLATTGRYSASTAEKASLLYVRNKIALTVGEQIALKDSKK